MRLLLPALALLLTPAAHAQDWAVDADASTVAFETTAFGAAATGEFERFSAAITFDPDNLAEARIAAEVDISSLSVGSSTYADAALGRSGLNPGEHPVARFTSSNISREGETYLAAGEIEIRGVAQPLELRFTLAIEDGRAVADGGFMLERSAFGVGGSDWGNAASTVEVRLHIEAEAAN